MPLSRRSFLTAALLTPQLIRSAAPKPLKIVVTGAHPGDPECGCGGTIAQLAAAGHRVMLLYLNRGEGFCRSTDPCASVRTAEAQKACATLKAHPMFASQVDGQSFVDDSHYRDFRKLIDALDPDLLFTQWPSDTHRDHRAVSALTLDAWLTSNRKAAFYYYEVADDTATFSPSVYVDISSGEIEALRRAACYAHTSQQPEKWYPRQVELTRVRGSQSRHTQAEAFALHSQSNPFFEFPGAPQQTVRIPSGDGASELSADLYGAGTRAVILAHGGRFNKESWKQQAEALAKAGFLAIAIRFRGDALNPDGSPGSFGSSEENAQDILAAIAYLRRIGARDISAVGGSLGGDAIGDAAALTKPDEISHLVFLGSSGGDHPEKLPGKKLFIVARDDSNGAGPRLRGIQSNYAKTSEPKELIVVNGSAHAQFLFQTDQADQVFSQIQRFLLEP